MHSYPSLKDLKYAFTSTIKNVLFILRGSKIIMKPSLTTSQFLFTNNIKSKSKFEI